MNVFIYGLSGSGKDTISNYLRDNFHFLKLRCAQTIKQVITEKMNITFDELENRKRSEPELRKLHWTTSQHLNTDAVNDDAATNRLQQIINRESMDFQMVDEETAKNQPIVVCDVRREIEIEMLLKAGFHGIFLTRKPTEFTDSTQSTEQYHITNGVLSKAIKDFPSQISVIFNETNDIDKNIEIKNNFNSTHRLLSYYSQATDGTKESLLYLIDTIIE